MGRRKFELFINDSREGRFTLLPETSQLIPEDDPAAAFGQGCDIEADLLAALSHLEIGQEHIDGGGAAPIFVYRRIA